MTRKDNEKDAERPHYYSQFWLDIAAGRRVIGGPKPEEAEAEEVEIPEVASGRKAGRSNADGYRETRTSAVVEPVVEEEEEEEEFEPEDVAEKAELPDIDFDEEELEPEPEEEETAEEVYPEEDFGDEEEEFYEEEEDDDDDDGWGRRGRKKAKPGRQTRQPPKKSKRDSRRSF